LRERGPRRRRVPGALHSGPARGRHGPRKVSIAGFASR